MVDVRHDIATEIELVQERIATQHFVIKSSGHDEIAVGAAAARLRELNEKLVALQAELIDAPALSLARL
ncbi:MAG: hypothetical protein JOZ70_02500 [Pseudolabrys sp.]|nr:hypothetical protein [Pseudolabrys sp.]MBV9954097.1 hypothetical protein [Pseudolabrys sp.]